MSVEDEIKLAELKLKQLEIQQKEHELKVKTRFDLTRAAVLVTVIGGVSAVLFQGVGALTALNEKKKAEVTAKSDFDFKGLELFIKEQGHLITCDQDESTRNLRLFQSLFSETVTAASMRSSLTEVKSASRSPPIRQRTGPKALPRARSKSTPRRTRRVTQRWRNKHLCSAPALRQGRLAIEFLSTSITMPTALRRPLSKLP